MTLPNGLVSSWGNSDRTVDVCVGTADPKLTVKWDHEPVFPSRAKPHPSRR